MAASERRQVARHPARPGVVVAGSASLHPLVARRCLGASSRPRAGARRSARHGVPRRHQHARAPEGSRCRQKGGSAAERDAREAVGRSRGGYGTKTCVIAHGAGRAIAFQIAPGRSHELPYAQALLKRLPDVPRWVVVGRGYFSHRFRAGVRKAGAISPSRPSAMRLPHAAQTGTTPTATSSSGSGHTSRCGEPLPHATKDRHQLHRRPLPRRYPRPPQVTTCHRSSSLHHEDRAGPGGARARCTGAALRRPNAELLCRWQPTLRSRRRIRHLVQRGVSQ